MTDYELIQYSNKQHCKLPEIELFEVQEFDSAIHSIRYMTKPEKKKIYKKIGKPLPEIPKMKILRKVI